ncbi:MAG TPA: hypothetical protein V6D14_23605 [Coleofasciculaceae cyanobacterium]
MLLVLIILAVASKSYQSIARTTNPARSHTLDVEDEWWERSQLTTNDTIELEISSPMFMAWGY